MSQQNGTELGFTAARILIVDDDPANLVLMRQLFEHDSYVVSAKNGQEALLITLI
jgi:CheY-like chemotaxis protein